MRLKIIFLFSFFILINSFAYAQEIKQSPREIITTGEAKIWIEPDRARVNLGMETMAELVDIARDENAKKIKQVMDALKSLKIEGMTIEAPSYNVSLVKEDEYQARKLGRLPKIIGYKVVQDFTVLLQAKDLSMLSKNAALVIDTALNNDTNIIQNVEFFKEDDTLDKRNVLILAVKDALENAKTIAETAGVSIKSCSLIESNATYRLPSFSQRRAVFEKAEFGGGGEIPTTLVGEKVLVTATARLKCLIE